jgi:uncharacterized membrane protein YdjX (TVP38/TMEM64 family)
MSTAKRSRASQRPEAPRDRIRTIIWAAVVLGACAAAYPHLRGLPPAASRVHFGTVRGAVDRLGLLAPAAAVLVIVAHDFLPFPGEIVLAAMGALFGLWQGFIIAWIGNILGAVVAFELGRALGPNHQPRTVTAKALRWVDRRVRGGDWRAAIVIRFVPMFPVSVFNFALGRTPVSRMTFLWTSAAGFIPMTAVLVAFGYGATGGQRVLPWATGLLAALIVGGLVYRYRLVPSPPRRA